MPTSPAEVLLRRTMHALASYSGACLTPCLSKTAELGTSRHWHRSMAGLGRSTLFPGWRAFAASRDASRTPLARDAWKRSPAPWAGHVDRYRWRWGGEVFASSTAARCLSSAVSAAGAPSQGTSLDVLRDSSRGHASAPALKPKTSMTLEGIAGTPQGDQSFFGTAAQARTGSERSGPSPGANLVGGIGGSAASIPMSPEAAMRKNLFVNTLEMSHKFSTEVGMPRHEADRLATYLTQLLCEHKERLSETYVEKASLQRALIDLEGRIASARAEVLKAQEMSLGQVQSGQSQLGQDIKTLRVEFKHEVDKLQSTQRLDINLERGNTREELRKMMEQVHEQDQKFERELNALRTQLEASKNDMIKWFVGMMTSVFLVVASALRMLGKW